MSIQICCRIINNSNFLEIPNTWYSTIFFVTLLIAIILGYTTEANLPWWGVLMAIGLSIIMVLPIGKIFFSKVERNK
jgi:uncharacterized membrane protein